MDIHILPHMGKGEAYLIVQNPTAHHTGNPCAGNTGDALHAQSEHIKHQRRSWCSNVELVFRCVANYDHAFAASEHDSCRSIQKDFCAYAHTLRRGLPSSVDVTQFLMLLHQSIISRALNLALRKTIDQSLRPWTDDLLVGPGGERMTDHGKQALSDLLEQCLETVEQDYQKFRTDMRQFRS